MKLLLAVDGSEFSQAATQAVASHFRPEGVDVLVVKVVEPPSFAAVPEVARRYGSELEARMKDDLQLAQDTVVRAAQALRNVGFKADPRVVEGEIRASILDVAAQMPADLIVMGSHGRRGVQRFLLGSVAESVARHSPCSVYIARADSKA